MPATSDPTSSSTREAILDAADRLLGRLGFQKTTLDDLARESRVGRRTIYLHFRGKEEIALASIDRVVARLCARLVEIAESRRSAVARLRDMLCERVLFRIDAVRDYHQGLDGLFAALRPAYMERRERYFAAEAELFGRVLREGVRSGELARRDPAVSARCLLLATNALLPYSLSPRELGARAALKRDIQALAGCLVDGLRARTDAPSAAKRVRSVSGARSTAERNTAKKNAAQKTTTQR